MSFLTKIFASQIQTAKLFLFELSEPRNPLKMPYIMQKNSESWKIVKNCQKNNFHQICQMKTTQQVQLGSLNKTHLCGDGSTE